MPDRDGIQFKIGDAFPPDSRLARWMVVCSMAQNDFFLVSRWLVPRLESEIEAEGYESVYLGRLAASHLFEAATFLRKGDRFNDVREFVAELDPEAQDAYRELLAIGERATGEFAGQLKRARGHFAHYSDLLPDQNAAYEQLRQAIKAHADAGTIGQIRDKTPPITGFRAMFADDIAAELTFPGDPKADDAELAAATGQFLSQVSEHIARYLQFARAAVRAYAAKWPDDAWEDWHEGDA